MGWRRASFKDQSVWAEVDGSGALAVDGGRVPIRYSDGPNAKVYRAGASRVTRVDGPIVELSAGVPAEPSLPPGAAASGAASGSGAGPASGAGSRRGSGFGKAGTRTATQAALAADAARTMLASLPASTARAFTDGACKGNPGPAGAGCRVELPDGRIGEASVSLGTSTNNVGELRAIGLALDLLDEAKVEASAPVALLTDSSYANGVLCRGWKAKANQELIKELRGRLATRPGVVLHWVAGHVGVEGNERADQLANAGVLGLTASRWIEA